MSYAVAHTWTIADGVRVGPSAAPEGAAHAAPITTTTPTRAALDGSNNLVFVT
jgi:hypothetical protein